MYENLSGELKIEGYLWSTLFGMAIWWGWKWRCGNVFGVTGKYRDRVKFIKELAKEVTRAILSLRDTRGGIGEWRG